MTFNFTIKQKIDAAERSFLRPERAILELDGEWQGICSQEDRDLGSFTVGYKTLITTEQYNDMVFMYACFNLLFLGDDNF